MSSVDDATCIITSFARAVLYKIKPTPEAPDQPSDQVIEYMRTVRKHTPDFHVASFALAYSLGCRYCLTYVNDDYEQAASVMDEITTFGSPGDIQDNLLASHAVTVPEFGTETKLAIIWSHAY